MVFEVTIFTPEELTNEQLRLYFLFAAVAPCSSK